MAFNGQIEGMDTVNIDDDKRRRTTKRQDLCQDNKPRASHITFKPLSASSKFPDPCHSSAELKPLASENLEPY